MFESDSALSEQSKDPAKQAWDYLPSKQEIDTGPDGSPHCTRSKGEGEEVAAPQLSTREESGGAEV
jgi:hypothetical protein